MQILLIVLFPILIILMSYTMILNRLIYLQQETDSAWSEINIQLKKRYNLIPNLVKTVKAYANHEKMTFVEVSKARLAAIKVPQ